jgi:hypothetical protein
MVGEECGKKWVSSQEGIGTAVTRDRVKYM